MARRNEAGSIHETHENERKPWDHGIHGIHGSVIFTRSPVPSVARSVLQVFLKPRHHPLEILYEELMVPLGLVGLETVGVTGCSIGLGDDGDQLIYARAWHVFVPDG